MEEMGEMEERDTKARQIRRGETTMVASMMARRRAAFIYRPLYRYLLFGCGCQFLYGCGACVV